MGPNRPGESGSFVTRSWLSKLQFNLREELSYFNPVLMRRGLSYTLQIKEFLWNADLGELTCAVKGSLPAPYKVTLVFGPEGLDEFYCDCTYSDGYGACKHSYAVLSQVLRRLQTPHDELQDLLLRGAPASNDWARSLADLDRFLGEQKRAETAPLEEPDARLVWRVALVNDGRILSLAVFPYEQKLTKSKASWTKGRKVTWDRFLRESQLWTNERDSKLAQALTQSNFLSPYGWYNRYQDPQPFDVLQQLIGHPLVYWEDAPEQALEVRSGQFGVTINADQQGWAIEPAVNGESLGSQFFVTSEKANSQGVVAPRRELNQMLVAKADRSVIDLVLRMRDRLRAVPEAGHEQLLDRLSKLQTYVPVTIPPRLLGGEREADTRLFLRLIPQLPHGLTADFRVRPTSEGLVCEPGEGAESFTSLEGAKPILVRRNLESEIARANEFMDQLGLARQQRLGPWKWKVTSDDDALDLISAAQTRQDQGLMLEWLEGAKMWVSSEITPQALRVEIEDHKDWFGLKGTIDIDGEQIPLQALLAGLRTGERYISLGKNKWVRIAEAFRKRLGELDDVVHHGRSGLELDMTAAPVVEEFLDESSVALKACQAWRDALARLENANDLDPSPPITLAADLRDYQAEGYRWLRRLAAWGVGGCLADDMGLGKTVQTLAVLLDRIEEGPALVVAPTSVGFNWVRESERFAPTLKPHLYRETDRNEFLSSLGEGDLVVISYGLLMRDIDKLAQVTWGTLVLDEAQKVKNSQTKTAQHVRQIDAKWRLALTGTPLENHLGELWSIFRAVCPGLLGSWDRFRTRFAEPIERDKDPHRRRALSRVLRPFILRRTKSEVLEELPARTEIRRTAEFSPGERKRYEDARFEAVAKLAGLAESETEDHRFQVLAALTRLRQLACHPKLVDAGWEGSSAKLDLLMEIVDELREGNHRALVFSQFTSHLALIRAALDARGIVYQYLDGKTPARQREELVDAFQRGEGELFLISLKAGGTGLNLTAADYVIHTDPWWNPAVEDQATDRAHRIGQTRPVTVYRLVTKDTIEEQILALHADKRHLVSDILEGTGESGKLSTQELVSLIKSGARDDGPAAVTAPHPPAKRRTVAR